MKTLLLAASVTALLTAPALAVVAAPSAPAPTASAVSPATASFYRFEVSIAGIDEGPKAGAATYTLVAEESQRAELRSGWNIPYASATGVTSRQQLGLGIELGYTLRGATVVVEGDVEIQGVDPASPAGSPTWRRVSARSVVPLVAGQPTQFASVYDIASKHRYEVTITAKRVL